MLISEQGEPLLTDFGVAGMPGVTGISDERVRASAAFTAPERLLDGAATPSADLYGLGATMYTLLAGEPAVVTKPNEDLLVAISRIVRHPVPDLREHGVPDPLARVVERMLAKSPVDRFATAADAVRALQAAQRAIGKPVTEAVIGDPSPARINPVRPRRPLLPDEDELTPESAPVTHPRYVPQTRPGRTGAMAAIPAPRTSTGSIVSATMPVRMISPRAPGSTPDALTAPIPTGFPIPRREPADRLPAGESATESPTSQQATLTEQAPSGSETGRTAVRRPAPRHAAGGKQAPGSSGFVIPPRQSLALVTAGAAVIGLALGVGLWLSRPSAAPPLASTSTTAEPPPVAPTTPAAPPTTGGATARQIAVDGGITHPARDNVADRLDGYFRALNDKNYDAAFGYFSPDSAVAGNGLAAFRKNNSTTEVQRQRIIAIDNLAADRLQVTVTYRSTQDAQYGPSGATCADWRLAYELTGPDRLIRRARLVTDPKPC